MAMMNGPEHYRASEDLLQEARHARTETERARLLQEAQVHATLALVVATLQGGQIGEQHLNQWQVFGKVKL